jgi:hypothetical protein
MKKIAFLLCAAALLGTMTSCHKSHDSKPTVSPVVLDESRTLIVNVNTPCDITYGGVTYRNVTKAVFQRTVAQGKLTITPRSNQYYPQDAMDIDFYDKLTLQVNVKLAKKPVGKVTQEDAKKGKPVVNDPDNQQLTGVKATFTLPYQPGELRAEAVAGSEVKGSVVLQTAGEAKTLRLTADHTTLQADGQDLAFVTIEALDAQGRLNPIAANGLKATVKGAATLQGLGNADVKDCDSYADATHHLWKGRALLVVRAAEKRGAATVTVAADGLKTASLKLKIGK